MGDGLVLAYSTLCECAPAVLHGVLADTIGQVCIRHVALDERS